jgi:hypothetical protein
VEACSSKWADPLRFSLYVANSPHDFERADSAIIDVGPDDEPGVVRVLEAFVRQYPSALAPRGVPYATTPGPMSLGRTEVKDKTDLCDGFGWRRSEEAVHGR